MTLVQDMANKIAGPNAQERKRGKTITFHVRLLRFLTLPAKYSLLFRLFQLPRSSRCAISRIVKVVSRLNRAAMASLSASVLACSLRSRSVQFHRFNSSRRIRSALAWALSWRTPNSLARTGFKAHSHTPFVNTRCRCLRLSRSFPNQIRLASHPNRWCAAAMSRAICRRSASSDANFCSSRSRSTNVASSSCP